MLILGKFNQNQYSEKYTFCCQQCFGNRITETLKIGHEIQMHLHHQSASELQQFFLDVIHGPTNQVEGQEYPHPLERSALTEGEKERILCQ